MEGWSTKFVGSSFKKNKFGKHNRVTAIELKIMNMKKLFLNVSSSNESSMNKPGVMVAIRIPKIQKFIPIDLLQARRLYTFCRSGVYIPTHNA